MGYTLPTRELLKGKANVHRIPTNEVPRSPDSRRSEKWLGKEKVGYHSLHWGTHDLKYMDAASGERVDPAKGTIQVPLAEYEKNLRQLTQRLKQTGAKLICVHNDSRSRRFSRSNCRRREKYNAVAAKIMAEEGVSVNDLCSFAQRRWQRSVYRPTYITRWKVIVC